MDENWILQPISFVENWGLDKCREEASAIANNLHGDMIDYGAFVGADLIGYITVGTERIGAEKLYISAHSSKESQTAYKALGCVYATEIIPWIAEEEPCDVQMEYIL